MNIESEQALLSILIRGGFESYHDIAALGITDKTFSEPSHGIIYKSIQSLFDRDVQKLDIPLIISAAHTIGYGGWIETNKDYLNDLLKVDCQNENVQIYGQKLRKLEVAREISKAAEEIQSEAAGVTGDEKLNDIFGIVESRLGRLASFLTDSSEDPVDIGGEIENHVQSLIDDPIDQLGLPTGFPIFDKSIGGGLRKHSITVIAARMKCGKSTLCKNIAYNVSKLGIPVLYLDTEMESEDQKNRLLASVADVEIDKIETGKFLQCPIELDKIKQAVQDIKNIKFLHKNIAGMQIESQLAVIRKWIINKVGLTKDGKAKDCLLVYDYIKLMDSKDLSKGQEHQLLGFLMTTLQGIAVKYDIPILSAAQLNRDGISKEDTSVIGGSDRIAQYGSAIAVLKWKNPEELAAESHSWGNQKLVPLVCRYGAGMDAGDYINIVFHGAKSQMLEKGTRGNSQVGASYSPQKANKKPEKQTTANIGGITIENSDDMVPF